MTIRPTGPGSDDPARVQRFDAGPDAWVTALAFTADGARLATSSMAERLVHHWTLGGELLGLAELPLRGTPPHPVAVELLAFSPEGRLLAAAHRERLRLYDVGPGGELAERASPEADATVGDGPMRFAFLPDGTLVRTAGGRGSPELVGRIPGAAAATWRAGLDPGASGRADVEGLDATPDGSTYLLAEGGGLVVHLRDGVGRVARELCRQARRLPRARTCALHPGGRWAAWSEADRIHLGDARTGAYLGSVRELSLVQALRFSPDGAVLLAGGGPILADERWRHRTSWLTAYRLDEGAPRAGASLREAARREPMEGYVRQLVLPARGKLFGALHGRALSVFDLGVFLESAAGSRPRSRWEPGRPPRG